MRRLLFLLPLLAAACATSPAPPGRVDDACAIFAENRDWFEAMRAAERRWGAPIHLQLAFIRQESGFRADARPPRERMLFGLLPGRRPSTAYGYAQAKDETWERYRSGPGARFAQRDDIDAATDFIGWYVDETSRRARVPKSDVRNQYLAYHEGQGGYLRGSWRQKKWLLPIADKVAAHAATYRRQLERCDRRTRG